VGIAVKRRRSSSVDRHYPESGLIPDHALIGFGGIRKRVLLDHGSDAGQRTAAAQPQPISTHRGCAEVFEVRSGQIFLRFGELLTVF
jgi:hypothetical protein